jgi:CheY-like chemotaxis protein
MAYKNLLLIDDDEDDQEIFLSAVRDISDVVRFTTFFSGIEALENLSQSAIRPDVIFLDLNMPVMNGQQFLVAIKKDPNLKDIPVIIFSTSSQPSAIQTVKELGAADFITKPGLFNELVNILRPLLT